MPFLAAMWLGEIVWLWIAMAGLSALAESYSLAFQILKWCGVAYLLVLAWQMWRAPAEIQADSIDNKGALRMFLAGLLVTFGNPKIMVFYVALLPTLLDMTSVTASGWVSLTLMTVLILSSTDIVYVVLAQRARKLMTRPDLVKWVNRSCAGIMTSAAALIAART
jgi:threonine/homoserine/homoserine lactone efflux protein